MRWLESTFGPLYLILPRTNTVVHMQHYLGLRYMTYVNRGPGTPSYHDACEHLRAGAVRNESRLGRQYTVDFIYEEPNFFTCFQVNAKRSLVIKMMPGCRCTRPRPPKFEAQ